MATNSRQTGYGPVTGGGSVSGRGKSDLALFTEDWKRLQQQKSRHSGGVEARILLNLGMYFGEQYLVQQGDRIRTRLGAPDEVANSLHLVFSMIRKAVRRKIGRYWSVSPIAKASPDKIDPKAFDLAEVVDKLVLALDKKTKERQLAWQRFFWILMGGVVVEHTSWAMEASREPIPSFDEATGELLWLDKMTQQPLPQSAVIQAIQAGATPERFDVKEDMQLVGDVLPEIISPLNYFQDASVPTIAQLGPDQASYIAQMKTVGWITENFGTDYAERLSGPQNLDIVRTRLWGDGLTSGNMNLHDLIPAVQGTKGKDDPDMCIVLTRYQPACHDWPHGRRTIFVPDACSLDDDDTPYDDGIPCTDIHFDAPTVSFWTSDFLTDMNPAQKFLNKRVSQLGEAANSSLYEILLLGGELGKEDIPTDTPGVVKDGLNDDGSPRVMALTRGTLPPWFMETIKFTTEFLENVGGADLMQHTKFPGQLRGSMSVPMIQELLDSEDGPFFDHYGEQLGQIKQQRVNRVKQFYEPIRTLHYQDANMKDEVLVFHTSDVLQAGTDFNITIDRRSLVPELAALREARLNERLSGPMAILYTNPRTGKMDPSMIAMDLKYDDRGRETREAQYRKLANQLIAKLWDGQPLDPSIPLPFWDHNGMMDELEAAMATTEWLEASPTVKQAFVALHEKHRQYLMEIQQAQADAAQAGQTQAVIAQASQQAAAKAASTAADAAIQQILAQSDQLTKTPMASQIAAQMGQGQQGPQPAAGRGPIRVAPGVTLRPHQGPPAAPGPSRPQ